MEVNLSGYSKGIRELRTKKVTVRPIKRKGGWVGIEHDSSFLNEGSGREYSVPYKARGNTLANPCYDFVQDKDKGIDDWQALSDELGLEKVRELNPNAPDNFWKRDSESTVKLDRNGKFLDLRQTRDFIEYLVLRSNSHLIAATWAQRFDDGDFKFALVEEGEEMVDKVSNLEEKKKAFMYLGKIDNSVDKMKDFLYVYYLNKKEAKRPPSNATIDWLKNELGKIIETDLKLYLEILDDDDYTLKLLIQRAVETGALLKIKHNYMLPGADTPIGVLDDLLEYLNDVKNQDVRMKLMHHVEGKVEA